MTSFRHRRSSPLCLSCLWKCSVWSDHSRQQPPLSQPWRMEVIPLPLQVSRDTPLKIQRNECAGKLLALTDVVVPPEDESTVKGRDPTVFIWHLWAGEVEGGADREWYLFFSRQSDQHTHLNIQSERKYDAMWLMSIFKMLHLCLMLTLRLLKICYIHLFSFLEQ